jgi:hypothetical protein
MRTFIKWWIFILNIKSESDSLRRAIQYIAHRWRQKDK